MNDDNLSDKTIEMSTVIPPNQDDILQAKLGYKSELHRGLDNFMNFAFGFTEVASLVSIAVALPTGLSAGGPSVLLWSFVATFACSTIVSYSMAELCSAYPSAGSVYYWAGQLVSEEWSPICSYITGWFNFIGNAANGASYANGFVSFLSAAMVTGGGKGISPQDQVGVSIVFLFLWTVLNFFRIDQVGWVNKIAAITHVGSIFVIIIACLTLTPEYTSGEFVFGKYFNNTGFESKGFVCTIGITVALYTIAGYEASAHLAEETGNSAVNAPKGIIHTVQASGWAGLILLISILFVTYDIDGALNGKTGNAFCQILVMATNESWGKGLVALVVINCFFAGVSSVAVTGRITYALARDGGFPWSSYISYIEPTFKGPINALLFVLVVDGCLMLLPLDPDGGATAFFAIIGLCVVGLQISYALPLLFKLIFKCQLPPSKYSLGAWSDTFAIISCAWLFGTSIFLFFPSWSINNKTTKDTMNWLVVVFTGTVLIMAVNWHYNSKYHFKGPKRVDNNNNNNNNKSIDEVELTMTISTTSLSEL